MSMNHHSQRLLLRSAAPLTRPHLPHTHLAPSCAYQRRTVSGWNSLGSWLPWNKNKSQDPLTENYLEKRAARRKAEAVAEASQTPKAPELGGLATSSIFSDVTMAREGSEERPHTTSFTPRNPRIKAASLDPEPEKRIKWERKMVIREVKRRGRLTKAEALKRTERVFLLKSHNFKTSVKKLFPLANQITGKTVEDAITQMRFSAKKVARDVKEHLVHTRNEAIVYRGMGRSISKFKPVQIMTKDGKRVTVTNPATLYVDQAWVGKGPYGQEPDFRARGRVNVMKNPSTSISIVLKEEATRIRLHKEREQKAKDKKVWVQLPNRPVTAQRQYYCW